MRRALLLTLGMLGTVASAAALPPSSSVNVPSDAATPAFAGAAEADAERELAALDRDQQALEAELAQLSSESELLRARTLARGRAYTRLARAGLLPVGAGFDEFVEYTARAERLHRALARDLELERKTLQRRTLIGKRLAELRAKRAPLEEQQRALSAARTALLAARDRELAFARAFLGSDFGDHTAVYGAPASALGHGDGGFASLKGRLPFPLAGRSEISAARRPGSGPGLEMRAPAGSPVRAVYPGRVAFADAYADYGRSIIIDHGSGYYTVSANLGELEVKVGDDVKGGERIATLPAASAGSALYFEVRIGQETADPAEWFGI
jgi:murein DD-endopeptidase MepM/ murein hydrolase activator NlpD